MLEPSIKQLRYLAAMAQHRHFGQAAKSCFVTQSTLSASIKDVEQILGIEVFERRHKKVLVTEQGGEVIARAHNILKEIDDLMAFTQQGNSPLSSKLTLGVIPTIAPYLLPPLLAALRTDYPQAQFFLRESQTECLLEDLKAGRIDAAIMAFPYPTSDMTTVPLFDDPFVFVGLPSSIFTQYKKLKIKHLEGSDLLLLEEGHCLREHALSACKLQSAQYSVPYQATSLPTLVQMVANNLGVTLLPKMAVDKGLIMNTGLVIKEFSEKSVKRSIGLVWRSSSSKVADLSLLAEYIKAQHIRAQRLV